MPTMSKFRVSGKFGPSRSNTASSIRGRVISNPIPIEDEDFPIRAPGTGIAIPLGHDGEDQNRVRSSTGTDLEHIMERPASSVGIPTDQMKSTSIPIPGQERPARPATSPITSSAVSNSATSIPPKASMATPQRKKSSLRTAFGRLFGRKRKSVVSSNGRASSPAAGARAGHHHSAPSAMAQNTRDSSNPQKRSASLPIDEYNRALRSHSVVIDTEDFPNLETPHGNNSNSIIADGHTRPRRATTPSRLWTPTKTPPGFATDWTGLSPRPASSHARGSKAISNEAEYGIGMAVTSGSHPNRRSRSVGELRTIINGPSIARRRSDEIRYWRESHDLVVQSPMSSNRAEEPVLSDDGVDPQVDPEESPQPFNFGLMSEMAGMKITQAASLETRVQRLESRMHHMEKAVIRIHRHHSVEALQLQDPPGRHNKLKRASFGNRPSTGNSETSLPKHLPRHRTLDESRYRSPSYGSSRPGTVTNNAQSHSSDSFPLSNSLSQETAPTSQTATARPLSTSTTIRGIPSSSPTISKDGSFTAEHLSYLTNSILNEQTARHELEKLVQNLSQQIQKLRSSNPSYPTPDSEHGRKVDEIAPGTVFKGEFSNFEQDDSSDSEVRYDEVFQTPNEEQNNFADDTFGDVMSGDDTKNTSRTMSLSRITVGKGMQLV